jgi:mycofactocin precursor
MTDEPTTPASDEVADETAVVEDVLVEEVSIDGMCGVY